MATLKRLKGVGVQVASSLAYHPAASLTVRLVLCGHCGIGQGSFRRAGVLMSSPAFPLMPVLPQDSWYRLVAVVKN